MFNVHVSCPIPQCIILFSFLFFHAFSPLRHRKLNVIIQLCVFRCCCCCCAVYVRVVVVACLLHVGGILCKISANYFHSITNWLSLLSVFGRSKDIHRKHSIKTIQQLQSSLKKNACISIYMFQMTATNAFSNSTFVGLDEMKDIISWNNIQFVCNNNRQLSIKCFEFSSTLNYLWHELFLFSHIMHTIEIQCSVWQPQKKAKINETTGPPTTEWIALHIEHVLNIYSNRPIYRPIQKVSKFNRNVLIK